MKGDIRCYDGRLMRHDPQTDDPDLETDIGECPDCSARSKRFLEVLPMTAPQPPAADDLVEWLKSSEKAFRVQATEMEQAATRIQSDAARIVELEARVKVLEEALRLCAEIVKYERDMIYDSNTCGNPPTLDPDTAVYIAEYDRALAAARAALGEG